MRAKPAIDLGIVEIAADKADAVAKPTPGFLVKRDRYAAHLAARHEAPNLLAEVVAELLVGLLTAAEPDDRKISRQEPGAGEVVDRRHDQPFGQIAGGAEDDQRTRRCSRAMSCATRLSHDVTSKALGSRQTCLRPPTTRRAEAALQPPPCGCSCAICSVCPPNCLRIADRIFSA